MLIWLNKLSWNFSKDVTVGLGSMLLSMAFSNTLSSLVGSTSSQSSIVGSVIIEESSLFEPHCDRPPPLLLAQATVRVQTEL
ncbi:hypothetical protein KC19_VG250000 [Ceratodon purpureus]|uniref:Uncharacterized protein n=1 Tax=Ceratodon purpureus TaxID=3225 RepID=A0A8T0HU63_CERPU|nr:hypothetical protein KC19_VG250000 [Ceratodon purpureus]